MVAAAWGLPGAGRAWVGTRTWLRGHSGVARADSTDGWGSCAGQALGSRS